MLERLTALLREKAEANAAHDGVPVGIVHLHGAAHELTALLAQIRDRLIGERGRLAVPVEAPAPEPADPAPIVAEPVELPAPEPASEED